MNRTIFFIKYILLLKKYLYPINLKESTFQKFYKYNLEYFNKKLLRKIIIWKR